MGQPKQQTLAVAAGFERFGRPSRRAEFLAQMEVVVPWAELVALIEPHSPDTGKGRPPVGIERMLRIYFLQAWFNLSDPAVDDALYESLSMRRFVGIASPGRAGRFCFWSRTARAGSSRRRWCRYRSSTRAAPGSR